MSRFLGRKVLVLPAILYIIVPNPVRGVLLFGVNNPPSPTLKQPARCKRKEPKENEFCTFLKKKEA